MYTTVLKLFNLVNIINEPTRNIGNSSTLIDPVINCDACRVVDSSTISVDIFISDHKAKFVSIRAEIPFIKQYTREIWNYKKVFRKRRNKKKIPLYKPRGGKEFK